MGGSSAGVTGGRVGSNNGDFQGKNETTSLIPQVYQGAGYVGAQANAPANVADVMLLSDGTRLHDGVVTWAVHGLTVGAWYFLSQSAASGFTATVPTSGIRQRLFFVSDANTVIVAVEEAIDLSLIGAAAIAKYVGPTPSNPSVVVGNFEVRFLDSSTDLQIRCLSGTETIKFYFDGFYNGGGNGGAYSYSLALTTAFQTFGDPGAIFWAENREYVFTPLAVGDQRAFRLRYTGWDTSGANPRKIIMTLEQI